MFLGVLSYWEGSSAAVVDAGGTPLAVVSASGGTGRHMLPAGRFRNTIEDALVQDQDEIDMATIAAFIINRTH